MASSEVRSTAPGAVSGAQEAGQERTDLTSPQHVDYVQDDPRNACASCGAPFGYDVAPDTLCTACTDGELDANLPEVDGTGPDVKWMFGQQNSARVVADSCRSWHRAAAGRGDLTWRDAIVTHIAEAIAEDDPARLRDRVEALVEVCGMWLGDLEGRLAGDTPRPITVEHVRQASNVVPVANLGEEAEFYVALGHVDKGRFLTAVRAECLSIGMGPEDLAELEIDEEAAVKRVVHCYAVTREWGTPVDEWAINWFLPGDRGQRTRVTPQTPGAYPITLLVVQ